MAVSGTCTVALLYASVFYEMYSFVCLRQYVPVPIRVISCHWIWTVACMQKLGCTPSLFARIHVYECTLFGGWWNMPLISLTLEMNGHCFLCLSLHSAVMRCSLLEMHVCNIIHIYFSIKWITVNVNILKLEREVWMQCGKETNC
jgi:hypothetical protein